MKNFVCCGDTISIVLSATFASGDGILVGTIVGVTKSSGVSGDEVAVALEGVYELPKATGAIAVGAKVYWDDTNKNITTTSAGNTLAGNAYKAEISGATTVQVRLNTV